MKGCGRSDLGRGLVLSFSSRLQAAFAFDYFKFKFWAKVTATGAADLHLLAGGQLTLCLV